VSIPFFSILLPTKNRSEIVGGAVESVLNQTFTDYELIVSDNDDSPTATAEVLARYPDARIRYCRTSGKLPMHENWENAFCQARGEHVLVLEDKMRLVPNALEILHPHASCEPVPISYPVTFAKGERIPAPSTQPGVERIDSRGAIEQFAVFSQSFFETLPKGLDSCAPRRLMTQIKRESPTGLAFSYICPDYSLGFMLLSRTEYFLRVKASLIYVPNNWMWQGKYSSGQSSYKKDAQIRRFVGELPVKSEDITAGVPLKSDLLWINLVLYDFRTKYSRPHHVPQINWVKYHAFCLVLVALGRRVGADMHQEFAAVRQSLRQQGLLFSARVLVDFALRLTVWAWRLLAKRCSRAG
jgi:glycosyltransferase involved in cell wall biosynthesis